MTPVSRVVLATALLLAGGTPFLRAQSVLTGTVRDSASRAPVADAEVQIPELSLRGRTDAHGKFLLEDISGGRYQVVVRRIGYDSASALVSFSGADSVNREFTLLLRAQPLPVVPVHGESAPLGSAKLAEFERRRHVGIGHFLTGPEIEKQQERLLSDVIQKLPGVLIVHAKGPVKGSGGLAAFAVSSRGQVSFDYMSATFGRNCPIAIWLDGVPVYRGNDKVSTALGPGGVRTVVSNGSEEPPFDINQINTKTVAAIEFYAGPAQMPPELNITQGSCGALVIWSK